MFSRRTEPDATALEVLITNHISAMAGMDEETEDYAAAASSLKVLLETRKIEHEIKLPWRPSADTVISAAASLTGIIAILTFEKWNVVTTKAVGFVPKIKI